MELVTRRHDIGGLAVLSLHGEIDLSTIPTLHNSLAQLARDRSATDTYVVDLDGVLACDDAGLGIVMGAAGRIRDSGGELFVVCNDGPLRSRLARTRFDRAVTVVESIAAASMLGRPAG